MRACGVRCRDGDGLAEADAVAGVDDCGVGGVGDVNGVGGNANVGGGDRSAVIGQGDADSRVTGRRIVAIGQVADDVIDQHIGGVCLGAVERNSQRAATLAEGGKGLAAALQGVAANGK